MLFASPGGYPTVMPQTMMLLIIPLYTGVEGSLVLWAMVVVVIKRIRRCSALRAGSNPRVRRWLASLFMPANTSTAYRQWEMLRNQTMVCSFTDYYISFTRDSARSKIDKFSKITNCVKLNNKQHHSKVLLNSFLMNGFT